VECGEPRLILPCIECASCDCCDCMLATSPIGTVLLNSYLDLSTRVSVANEIDDGGVKALGDALIHNTTLTSLLLNLGCG
jgi:hypothetical protein